MYNVLFKKGLKSAYDDLAVKDANTFYFTSDDSNLYLGEIKLSNAKDVAAAITRITTNETDIAKLKTDLGALVGGEGSGSISDIIDSAIAEIVGTVPEGKTVIDLIDEAKTAATYDDTAIKASIKTNTDAIAVLNGEKTEAGSVKKTVADAIAEIVAEAPESFDTLKEISDWISNHSNDATAMNTAITTNKNNIATLVSLIGELPEDTTAESLVGYIDEKISSIDVSDIIGELPEGKDVKTYVDEKVKEVKDLIGTIPTGKTVKDILDEIKATADAALTASDITTGSTNGTIAVDGTDVPVKGLGTAAYVNTSAFDASGSAAAAETNAKKYTDDALTWQTIE